MPNDGGRIDSDDETYGMMEKECKGGEKND